MEINRIYEHQNLLSLQLVSFLVGLRTYQHPGKFIILINNTLINKLSIHCTGLFISPSGISDPFGVTIPAAVPQGSEIPEGLINNPV
jgi:hypothetical protein